MTLGLGGAGLLRLENSSRNELPNDFFVLSGLGVTGRLLEGVFLPSATPRYADSGDSLSGSFIALPAWKLRVFAINLLVKRYRAD